MPMHQDPLLVLLCNGNNKSCLRWLYNSFLTKIRWKCTDAFITQQWIWIYCRIWSWSPMPCEKHGLRDSVDKNRGRRPRFLSLLRPEGAKLWCFQWRESLMLSLICARINSWVNNREAGDLRRYRAHYDVIVMNKNAMPPDGLPKLAVWVPVRPMAGWSWLE